MLSNILGDMWTIMWKEWKEMLLQRGQGRSMILNLALVIGVFGVFLPLQMGSDWVQAPALIFWAWVPLLLVSSVIADSFAGERERHTLETLLASRLSDRAILLGKVAAAIGYGWGLSMVSVIAGLITVNVTSGQGRLLMYAPEVALGIVLLSFLASALVAGLGVLVSLRAATVRQAAQTLSIGTMILLWAPIMILQALPQEQVNRLASFVQGINGPAAFAAGVVALAALDLLFLALAAARFQRARLILD